MEMNGGSTTDTVTVGDSELQRVEQLQYIGSAI